jgi:hypothetical protein
MNMNHQTKKQANVSTCFSFTREPSLLKTPQNRQKPAPELAEGSFPIPTLPDSRTSSTSSTFLPAFRLSSGPGTPTAGFHPG